MDREVFVSYRGEDSHSYGTLLYTELRRHFGDEHVFLDCESIPPGSDFVQELLDGVRSARVLLVVIGPRWLTAVDAAGRRRIDDPADWVRRELAEAFTAGVRVIPILTEQVQIPTHAELPAQIAALSRCQYRRLRHHEPTADLARIVTDLTKLDPALAAAACSREGVPRQLPAAPGLFIGRATELATLTDTIAAAPGAGSTVVISAIAGCGGIGKTALALHWAHRHTDRFPDGQLFVNLRGFDPSAAPTAPEQAVRGFLTALGVDSRSIPTGLDAQAALYRSLVVDKRMLILLDNAADTPQLTPLLPGSPTCAVVITSRRHLTGLAVNGARYIELGVLPDTDARRLLVAHLGQPHTSADMDADAASANADALEALVRSCAGLPLALRIVAARAAIHPGFPLTALVEELHDTATRLDALDAGELGVNLRAVLDGSYRALDPGLTQLFVLLGVTPGPVIGLPAAASLAGRPPARVRVQLRQLEAMSLIQQPTPGRYRMHDLIRLYAIEHAHHDLASSARSAALRRLVEHYTHTAILGDRLLFAHRDSINLAPLPPGCQPCPLPDASAAVRWFDTEHRNLLASQHLADAQGWDHSVWQLAWGLETFQYRRAHLTDGIKTWHAAAAATDRLNEPTSQAWAHRNLGWAYGRAGRYTEALDHHERSITLANSVAEQTRDTLLQSRTHLALSWTLAEQGDDQGALTHAAYALDTYPATDPQTRKASILSTLGWLHGRLGHYDQAQHTCEHALTLARKHHQHADEADTLDSLGYIASRRGQHIVALRYYQLAADVYRDLGTIYREPDSFANIGDAHAALNHTAEATTAWRRALELFQAQHRTKDIQRIQRLLAAADAQSFHNQPIDDPGD